MIEFDGQQVIGWIKKSSSDDHFLLIECEYSDDNDVWFVGGLVSNELLISKDGDTKQFKRPLNFFEQGTFFFSLESGTKLRELLQASLTEVDKQIAHANEVIRSHGLSASELGGSSSVTFLAELIENYETKSILPNNGQWERLHEIFVNRTTSIMRTGIPLITKWLIESENKNNGLFDLYRRVLLAVIFRRTGQFDKALKVSDVVDLPRAQHLGGFSSVSVLCTTRAATMMDLAEIRTEQRDEYLKAARLALNKANAVSGGDAAEIRDAYMRLKKLDAQSV